MGRFLNNCAVLIFWLTSASAGHAKLNPSALAAPGTSNKIIVHIYNYRGVPPRTLDRAEREARRIFRKAGIETEWFNEATGREAPSITLCEDARGPSHVILNILPRSVAEASGYRNDSFGVAFNDVDDDFGSCAYVFYDRVKELAARTAVHQTVPLAHFLAHEIGHLLLGPKSHSPVGLMRGEWSENDLDKAAKGCLAFTSTESEHMRSAMLARNRKGNKIIVSSSK